MRQKPESLGIVMEKTQVEQLEDKLWQIKYCIVKLKQKYMKQMTKWKRNRRKIKREFDDSYNL